MGARRTGAGSVLTVAATVVACLAAVPATAVGASGGAAWSPAVRAEPGVHYALTRPACRTPAPGHAGCDAIRLVRSSSSARGARAYRVAASYPVGPAGGYTPDDLATAYGVNPDAAAAASQTVAIVDAYNDPNAVADLDAFDVSYGLPPETSSSLRIVGQTGSAAALPANDTTGWSAEESLDLDAVRGLCHRCSILLVETDSDDLGDLAAGVQTAVALGADEVSNSYGGAEDPTAAPLLSDYNHPGVVVTASTGDDGWHDWDTVNQGELGGSGPEFPSSAPTVVAVGGTSLLLTSSAVRQLELVWNENGPSDSYGLADQAADGATGGGCSSVFAAPAWQRAAAGFGHTGCGATRLAADVAADADPYTGYDIYDSYDVGDGVGWATYGGTSLAAPTMAAMWALAGGAHGVAYPAQTLYERYAAGETYDVTFGGNGVCGGDPPSTCADNLGGDPNALGAGEIDCAYSSNPADTAPRTDIGQCTAAAGYDGPSGVGTPTGPVDFVPVPPTVHIVRPAALRPGAASKFGSRITAAAPVASYTWSWGDGSADSSGASPRHTYRRAGTYHVTVVVADDAGQRGRSSTTVTLGKKPTLRVHVPAHLAAGHNARFRAVATDPNTGGRVTGYRWRWGDGTTSHGARGKHRFRTQGRYRVTLTVTDNVGLRAHRRITVRVGR